MSLPPQTVNAQTVSSNSSLVFQPVNFQEDSTAQAVSTSSSQTISCHTVSSPKAISSWEDSTSQPASTSSPQTSSYQVISSSQVVSADPQVVSISASQAGSPQEDSTSQAASTSSQAHNTNSKGASTTLPLVPQVRKQPNSTNTPKGSPKGNSLKNHNRKWVISLSSKPLTQAQRSVLTKGPNFVVTPRHPSNLQYITATEAAYTKLGQQDAEEHSAENNRVLRSSPKT